MAIHFHKLEVKEVKIETPECVSVSFKIPKEIEREFHFIPGQNITIKKNFNGQEIRRSYSICSSHFDNELRIAVKKVNTGLFSAFANEELKKGDILEVLPPTGNFFTKIHKQQKKNYVFIAAGSGITPVISLIKTILQTEEKSTITLLYGNKGMASVIFKDQLEWLKDKYLQRFNPHYIFSREKTESDFNYGRISWEKLNLLSKIINLNKVDEFFICGPEKMINTVKDFLRDRGIEPGKIHFELFTTPANSPLKVDHISEKKITEEGSDVTLKIDGRSFDFKLEYNGPTILEAGLSLGADLPYACKGGVCCSCKAKLLEGEAEMEANYGLEKSEIKDGFILTCQSHPTSQKVIVDFDQG